MSESAGLRTYGGWGRPRRQGMGGQSLGVSAFALVGAIAVTLTVVFAGWKAAAIALVVVLIAGAPLAIRFPGQDRTLLTVLTIALRKRRQRRTGSAVLAQGAVGLVPDGRCRLPGLSASSYLRQAKDLFGTPFGVIVLPSTGHYTVAFECTPAGQQMIDQQTVDIQVAEFGGWLNGLGSEGGDIVGAQVVVECSPDPGVRLRSAIDSEAAEDRPAFVAQVMEDIKTQYGVGQARISTRVTVTFASHGSDEEHMLHRIGDAVPSLAAGLVKAGAGSRPRPMTGQDLADAVRVAYDPVVAPLVERERAAGGTHIAWDEAGPAWHDDRSPDVYEHDRAWSVSWQMLSAPRNIVYSDVLTRLLSPHRDVACKRVTMLYRPQDVMTTAAAIDSEVANARFAVNSARRSGEREVVRLQQARAAAREEAQGAGLVRFGMVVTATVLDPADLSRARETVKQLSAGARIRLRPARRLQAAVFAAGLPIGLVLPKHLRIPAEIRELL